MKVANNVKSLQSLLGNVANNDICETLHAKSELEDAIFQQLERVQALSTMQYQIDASEGEQALPNRLHYSHLLDDQVTELRRLLTSYFG